RPTSRPAHHLAAGTITRQRKTLSAVAREGNGHKNRLPPHTYGRSSSVSHRLLFLCTGNYYRSRFAELLFNAQAVAASLAWRAESRGIALELGVDNRGPISEYALAGLQARGIGLDTAVRFPQQVCEADLARAERIIALDGTEHRPLLAHRFPHWVERVEFW